jgi:single-strand DNA-binding protein
MARSLNRATLIGNLGADPEVRSTSNGNRVAQFSLATSRSWTDGDGAQQERTEWHRVVVWGSRVEVVKQYLHKGDRVYVEGEIQYRSYEDGEGVTRYVTDINAREILLLGGRDGNAATKSGAEVAEPKAPARKPRKAAAAARGGSGVADSDDDLPF